MVKKITALSLAVIVFLALTIPVTRAELIFAPDFPINGVKASQLPKKSLPRLLLTAYENDTTRANFRSDIF